MQVHHAMEDGTRARFRFRLYLHTVYYVVTLLVGCYSSTGERSPLSTHGGGGGVQPPALRYGADVRYRLSD